MTTTFEHPQNGYRVRVNDGASFILTLLFGGFYFLARGSVRHFFLGLLLGLLTFGLSWLVYPFFAAGILRNMYFERGYNEVPTEDVSGSLAPVLALAVLAPLAVAVWYHFPRASTDELAAKPVPSRPALARAPSLSASPDSQRVAVSKREAVLRYPELGVPGSAFNAAFVTRHGLYQQELPEFFQDENWPMRLADEVARTVPRK